MPFLPETAQRVVVKLGSSILTSPNGEIDEARIQDVCRQIDLLIGKGIQIIVVSSGAISLGMGRLGIRRRPTDIDSLQACAAVGQSILANTWQAGFNPYSRTVAQILLTREDIRPRKRHIAVKNLFEKLLTECIVPIVNENDSVSTEEIKFGDNDILSALVASFTKAEILIMLTAVPGLIDRTGTQRVVSVVEEITPEIEKMAGDTKSETSVGGMHSKIEAAKISVKSGCGVFIGDGRDPDILIRLLRGAHEGTLFVPQKISLVSKKRWLAFFGRSIGVLTIDEGACRALCEKGSSLLATGIISVEGDFKIGAILTIESANGMAVARGITQYSSDELAHVIGQSSAQIRLAYPERKRLEAIHRDSLVVL
jgi:glutamate 5-kinase